jgi:leucyl aminopeptidase (aminopeptidase T)
VEVALVDGAAGLAIVPQGELFGAIAFTFRAGRIVEIEMISEPDPQRVDLAGAS